MAGVDEFRNERGPDKASGTGDENTHAILSSIYDRLSRPAKTR
jgi:hypothetical protein